MKKYLFMAVASIVALTSCSKDNDEFVNCNTPHQMTFMAGYSDVADTRATMAFTGAEIGNVSFDANDQISILSAKNTNAQFTTAAGGESATFTGTAADDSKFYAVYPYTSGLTLEGTTIHGVTIPTTQTSSKWGGLNEQETWGWDPKAPIAVAVADANQALTFDNLCAILKIDINFIADAAAIFTVQVNADQNIAGTFDLNTDTRTLTATNGSKKISTDNVTINLNSKCHFYLAIAPGTYTNFSLKVTRVDFGDCQNMKNTVTFEAGKVYTLPVTLSYE